MIACNFYICLFLTLVSVVAKSLNKVDDPVCGYDSCTLYDPRVLNVHLVAHSHNDVGWLRTVDQYYFEDVQYVLSSVVLALKEKKERRFVQVEIAFLKKWWDQQDDAMREDFKNLVNNGQLEIINAGWSMNDEGAVHYQSTIDQYTLGMRYVDDTLGKCGRSRVGWQIDTFGHSREQASISAQLGFDSMFFARFDFRDKEVRQKAKTTDMLWRGSASLGNTSDIMTSIIHNHYSAPAGFCFDIVCNDAPIIDDKDSPDYNYKERVEDFAKYIRTQASVYPTNNILITMGDDFRYTSAITTYINLDLLIKGFDLFPQTFEDKPIKVYYSTPSCYTKGVHNYVLANDMNLDMKTDDFMPLAQKKEHYLTGYYTSRATSKRLERQSNNLLQVAKQLVAFSGKSEDNDYLNEMREIMGIMQHHDAITGTERQEVTDDYYLMFAKSIKTTNNITDSVLSSVLSDPTNPTLYGFDSCLLSNISYCPQTKSDQFIVVIYNPLSRVVSTPVNIPVESGNFKITPNQGQELAYQVTNPISDFSYVTDAEPSPYTLTFIAENLPPLGAIIYNIEAIGIKKEVGEEKIVEAVHRIGYDETFIEIDDATGLMKTINMNGVSLNISQDLLYYRSKDGAYEFNPEGPELYRVATDDVVKTIRISGDLYEGVVQEFGSWAKQIIKIYKHDRSSIEIDWLVGPIDISDGYGKEIISKFTTSLATNETWYTDSNGRELIERRRNYRPTFNYTDERHVPANFFPVDSRIILRDEDKGIELAVLTDRSEGGSSLQDGEMEIMIQRACVQIDFGDQQMIEEQYGQLIVVRGQHHLVLGPIAGNGEKTLAAIERELVLKKHLSPWIFLTNTTAIDTSIEQNINYLVSPLPDNIHLLTLELWNEDSVLLRLEHILETDDDPVLSKETVVDLTDAFHPFRIVKMDEMSLGANMKLEENVRLEWPGSSQPGDESGVLNINERVKRDPTDLKIILAPMQIRTFVATIEQNR